MAGRIHALIIDYGGTGAQESATRLSLQLVASRQSGFDLEVVHWDNGNDRIRVLSSEQRTGAVVLERSNRNLGYAGAINEFVERRRKQGTLGDALWILNPDLEVAPDALLKLWKVLEENPRCAAVGGRVFKNRFDGPVWGTRGGVSPWLGTTWMSDWQKRGPLPKWSYLPGCSPLIRTTAFTELGGFPEAYFLYFEETEFCVRAQKADWELWVEPDARIIHHVDSFAGGIPSPTFAYYFTRAQFLFWKRCFRIPRLLQLPRTLYVVAKEVALPLRRAKLKLAIELARASVLPGLWDGLLGKTGQRSSK